jgi:hypothetical protein
MTAEIKAMHELYQHGGGRRSAPVHVVYVDANCPHSDCTQHLQAIDFRLEAFGRAVHNALVKSWWDDVGFVGRCPTCGHWIHFTIRGKKAIDEAQARYLPQLPDNWSSEAVIL